jgi:hypothetical protein
VITNGDVERSYLRSPISETEKRLKLKIKVEVDGRVMG